MLSRTACVTIVSCAPKRTTGTHEKTNRKGVDGTNSGLAAENQRGSAWLALGHPHIPPPPQICLLAVGVRCTKQVRNSTRVPPTTRALPSLQTHMEGAPTRGKSSTGCVHKCPPGDEHSKGASTVFSMWSVASTEVISTFHNPLTKVLRSLILVYNFSAAAYPSGVGADTVHGLEDASNGSVICCRLPKQL